MPSEQNITCPVCGFTGLDDFPYDGTGCPSYTICPCCGTEFGYDDSAVAHRELRVRWKKGGMLWWSKRRSPPMGWDPKKQMNEAEMAD